MLRIHLLDVLRGVSVFAMVVYHFFWDLGYFNFIDLEKLTQGLPLLFAQCIGASFITISGISFGLASNSKDFSIKFMKRIGILISVCFLITLSTFFLDKSSFIFFGILHLLATCSFIGLFLIKVKHNYILFFLFVFSLIPSITKIKYELPSYLIWLGLNIEVPITNDFYPLFPWVSFYIFGLWACKPFRSFIAIKNKSDYSNFNNFTHIQKSLLFLGKNSLTIYILHQPIFFSLFLILIRISS